MKQSRLLFGFLLIMFSSLFVACEETTGDDEDETGITIEGTVPTTVTAGEDVNVSITVVAEERIESIVLSVNGTPVDTKTDNFTNSTSDTYTGVVLGSLTTAFAGNTVTINILVTDKKGNTESKDYTVTVSAAAGAINSYSAKMLFHVNSGAGGSFYSVGNDMVHLLADARNNSETIDFVYFFGSSNKATLAAPSNDLVNDFNAIDMTTFATRNATKFGTTAWTMAEFNSVSDDAAIVASEPTSTVDFVNELEAEDVLYFETAAGKKGLVLIKSIGATSPDYTLEIMVKVQQ